MFSARSIKIPESYFSDKNRVIIKLLGRGKRPRIGNSVWEKKNKIRGLTLPIFKKNNGLKKYYKAVGQVLRTVINSVLLWQKPGKEICRMGIQNGMNALEDGLAVSCEIKHILTIPSSSGVLWYLS